MKKKDIGKLKDYVNRFGGARFEIALPKKDNKKKK